MRVQGLEDAELTKVQFRRGRLKVVSDVRIEPEVLLALIGIIAEVL